MKPYNTAAGIESYLTDLDGLHRLIRARRDAYHERNERLSEFLILGRFWTDTCGNFGPTKICYRYGQPIPWFPDAVPRVVSNDQIRALLPELTIDWSVGAWPPTSAAECAECGRSWTLETCHDAVDRRTRDDELIYEHKRCAELIYERRSLAELRQIVGNAGLGAAVFVPVPGEYLNDGLRTWALLSTPFGDIKVGRRKRVFSIDWTDVVKRATDGLRAWSKEADAIRAATSAGKLFAGEDVTKGDTYVHAWGAEKAVEYLEVIHAAAKGAST